MNRLYVGLALVAAFLAGGLLMNRAIVRADDPPPRPQLYQKWRELGLSKDQTSAIYKIMTEHRVKIAKLEAEVAKLKKEERAEAEKVLTPAQKARLRELLLGDTGKEPAPRDKAVPKDK
jgi:Spy/CpxP family protein refolding chaperone